MSIQTHLALQASTTHLPADSGVQLVYIALDAAAHGGDALLPMHCCLVVDCSPSMRVPVADEAMFRELMRRGLAHEVVVDGLPVWQVTGGIPADLKGRAISPSRWVVQAVGSATERLTSTDRVSLIVFASQASLLLRQHLPTDSSTLRNAVWQIEHLEAGSGTQLAPALQRTLELMRDTATSQRASRVLLITDGFAEDADECLRLMPEFAAESIPITTLGLGVEFQEQLLLALADQSGGNAALVTDPQQIPPLLDRELARAGRTLAQRARLDLRLAQGVELRRVYRVRPALAEVPRPTLRNGAGTMILGPLERDSTATVLLELLVPPHTAGEYRLLRATLQADQADGSATSPINAEWIVKYGATAHEPVPVPIQTMIDRVAAFRLQTRALDAARNGDQTAATRQLEAAVTRLIDLGEHDLAARTAAAAQQLATTGQVGAADAKQLRYATRRLSDD